MDAAVAGAVGLNLFDRTIHGLRERNVVFLSVIGRDTVNLSLGCVDQSLGLAVAGVAQLHNFGTSLNQAAQHSAFGHDFGVEPGVSSGGDARNQGVQVGCPAHAVQFAALGQLVGYGDGVRRLAVPVEVDNGLIDHLVGGLVEVSAAADDLNNVGDGVFGEHHAAQYRLLGGVVVRWCADELRLALRQGGPLGGEEYGELLSSHLRAPGDHRFAVRLDAGEVIVDGKEGIEQYQGGGGGCCDKAGAGGGAA